MLFTRLVLESFSFAYSSLQGNKLRTFLSLLGITIGIFAIISVFTVIDSLENYIRSSLNSLGSNMVYIQKWPWAPPEGESEYPWWKYMNRPVPTMEEADELGRRSKNIEDVVYFFGFNRTVQFENSKAENTEVLATTHDLINTWSLEIEKGRYFTESESNSGAGLVILGSELAVKLFDQVDPVGKMIKIQGHRLQVIGVYLKKGTDMFGTSMDKRVHIPVVYAMSMVDVRDRDQGQAINIKAKPDADHDEFIAEIEGQMRSLRRLRPLEENDFAINEVSVISTRFDAFFKVFNFAGWIIGGFSILVGGFGIANIMFVSVKERTKIIGLQKALGAKKRFILLEFLFEASVLSMIGGAIGLLIIYGMTLIVSKTMDFNLVLTVSNIVKGLVISAVIGLVAGLVPARTAANLDPVTAMNAI